jgi:2-dehydropantoate 2-reductase
VLLVGIVMIGSGSIGMLVTFYLSKQGHDISLFTNRPEQAEILNEKGLHLIIQGQRKECMRVEARPFSDIERGQTIDLVILAVKSYQVKGVINQLTDLEVKIKAILFLQNGMSHTELIPVLKIPEIAVAVVEHGAIRESEFIVHQTGVGQLKWSYVRAGKGLVKDIFPEQTNSAFDVSYMELWSLMLERKLIVNACINPLTALFQIKNGELIENDHYRSMMHSIFCEVAEVLKLEKRNEVWNYVKEICEKTAGNQSSMLVDILRNRPTEIDSIIGFVIRKAVKQKQAVSILPFLFDAIRAKELKMEVNQDG